MLTASLLGKSSADTAQQLQLASAREASQLHTHVDRVLIGDVVQPGVPLRRHGGGVLLKRIEVAGRQQGGWRGGRKTGKQVAGWQHGGPMGVPGTTAAHSCRQSQQQQRTCVRQWLLLAYTTKRLRTVQEGRRGIGSE